MDCENVLLCGDLHVPYRAEGVPKAFKDMLLPGKMQHVVCTGNLCGAEEAAWLKSLAPRMTLVRGDFDDDDSVPETAVTTVGAFRIGVCHGHTVVPWGDVEALATMARRLDCDILVTGHTHVQSVVEVGGRLLVNPGSMTGAFSATTAASAPAFQLLSLTGHAATVFSYGLARGEVQVTKLTHTKGGGGSAAAAADA
ncbi:hypothetical protein FNF27_07877 [Cafeteria roenbergensis]|nr:hypothetical protein FNF31_05032 [Cafeteria roenbergensis]KAA0163919.1 hypothetical protein FNF27_07877 [Cafeteria roenbergensis]